MNRFRQFRRLLPTERRAVVTILQTRTDGTSIVQTPEGRTYRARGTGIQPGNKAYVLIRQGQAPELNGVAPDLPLTIIDTL